MSKPVEVHKVKKTEEEVHKELLAGVPFANRQLPGHEYTVLLQGGEFLTSDLPASVIPRKKLLDNTRGDFVLFLGGASWWLWSFAEMSRGVAVISDHHDLYEPDEGSAKVPLVDGFGTDIIDQFSKVDTVVVDGPDKGLSFEQFANSLAWLHTKGVFFDEALGYKDEDGCYRYGNKDFEIIDWRSSSLVVMGK